MSFTIHFVDLWAKLPIQDWSATEWIQEKLNDLRIELDNIG